MRFSLKATCFLAAIALISFVQSEELKLTYDDGVVVATSENIDKIIDHFNGTILLELYAPWW